MGQHMPQRHGNRLIYSIDIYHHEGHMPHLLICIWVELFEVSAGARRQRAQVAARLVTAHKRYVLFTRRAYHLHRHKMQVVVLEVAPAAAARLMHLAVLRLGATYGQPATLCIEGRHPA
jgi:hypothetical protein